MQENPILVRMQATDSFIALSTVSRKHGRKGRFFIDANRLAAWLQDPSATFFDSDCGNWLRLYRAAGEVYAQILWVDCGTCIQQSFRVSPSVLAALTRGETEGAAFLSRNEPGGYAKVQLAHGAHIPSSPHIRGAFRKALGNSFRWRGCSTVTLYNDGRNDYFFVETLPDGSRGLCGGLIYSGGRYNTHT